jgi:hypothetical protein
VPAIAQRGLVSLFTVTADLGGGDYDIEVRGAASDTGSLYLQALGIGYVYSVSAPWYFENDAASQDFYIGIKNKGASSRTFTLTSLRVERFA